MEIADIFRFLGVLAPLFTPLFNLFTELRKRVNWTRRTQSEVGNLGWIYWVINVLPNIFFKVLLGLIILASLVAIIEGAYKVSNKSSLSEVSNFLFENSLWIFVIWVVTATITYFNIIPRILLKLFELYPGMNYKPGWINAKWHIESGEEAIPVNVNKSGYEAVANNLVKALGNASAFSGDRALRPDGVSDDELANLFLFGCIIEGKIYDLHFTLAWKNFYQALGRAARADERPFSPESIKKIADEKTNFYKKLIDLCSPYELPDEPQITSTVNDALEYLNRNYNASAKSFAFSFWHRNKPSIRTAIKRAKKIPRLNQVEHGAMRTQFLKLAAGNGVWQGIDPGQFVFPFSKNLAVMLFRTRCLITTPNAESIQLTEDIQHLVAYTEKIIVNEVRQILLNTLDTKIIEDCYSVFQCKPNEVSLWKLSYEIDYLLWYLSRHPEINEEILIQRGLVDETWKIDGNSIVRG